MNGMTDKEVEEMFLEKGYTRRPDGSWSKEGKMFHLNHEKREMEEAPFFHEYPSEPRKKAFEKPKPRKEEEEVKPREETAMQKTEPSEALAQQEFIVSDHAVKRAFDNAAAMAKVVEEKLERGVHYDIIPGTQHESLLDPGASDLFNIARVHPKYHILEVREDEDGHVTIMMENQLVYWPARPLEVIVGSGVGAASSHEIKYAYRWMEEADVPKDLDKDSLRQRPGVRGRTLFRVPNPDIGDLWNTLIKMAAKRTDVDSANHLPGVAAALARIRRKTKEKN